MIEITNEIQLNEIIKHGVTIIEFYSDDCVPCKQIQPHLEKLEQELHKMTFVKVNRNKLPLLASKYHVMSVPTFYRVVAGTIINNMTGVGDIKRIENFVRG